MKYLKRYLPFIAAVIIVGGLFSSSAMLPVMAAVHSTYTEADPNDQPDSVDTSASTEAAAEPSTEAPSEAPTEAPTEPPTEAPTEPSTEAPTEPPTEVPTEPPTEAPTEPPTEAPTEPSTEVPTEPSTEVPTEPSTEVPTKPSSEAPTKAPAEPPTEASTKAPETTKAAETTKASETTKATETTKASQATKASANKNTSTEESHNAEEHTTASVSEATKELEMETTESVKEVIPASAESNHTSDHEPADFTTVSGNTSTRSPFLLIMIIGGFIFIIAVCVVSFLLLSKNSNPTDQTNDDYSEPDDNMDDFETIHDYRDIARSAQEATPAHTAADLDISEQPVKPINRKQRKYQDSSDEEFDVDEIPIVSAKKTVPHDPNEVLDFFDD